MFDLPIILDRASRTPLSRQVADQLRAAAARGAVRVGDRLPSTRSLADTVGVSRTVTATAYDQLYAEGWIAARHGSGTYVEAVPVTPAEPDDDAAAPVSPGAELTDHATPTATDLRPGSPWVGGLDRAVWRRAWRRASDAEPDGQHQRAGLVSYRAAVAEHLLRHRGLSADRRSVLATGGTTAAVTELALALLPRDGVVAMEEPGYQRAVGAFRAAGLRVVPAPVDAEGVVVDRLPEGVAAVYCTPAHQYPLGGRLPAARRIALVEWARRHGVWLIEDDYDGELRYDVAPLPLLAGIGPDVVIHLGTTSKILSPSLGIGWLVGAREVIHRILAHRDAGGVGPSLAGQRILTALAESGDLSRHLRRVRRELSARRALVTEVLAAAGLTVLGDRAGAHVVVVLDDQATERRIVAAALEAGVRLDGLRRCFAGDPKMSGITLGYAAPARLADLAQALRVVADLAGSPDRERTTFDENRRKEFL